jgi:hypothetical protein
MGVVIVAGRSGPGSVALPDRALSETSTSPAKAVREVTTSWPAPRTTVLARRATQLNGDREQMLETAANLSVLRFRKQTGDSVRVASNYRSPARHALRAWA